MGGQVIVCKLIDSIWSTRKYDELGGMKLMRVEVLTGDERGKQFVCVDTIGAGAGERVLVVTGVTAHYFIKEKFGINAPVDAVIVGIIDEDVDL